MSCTIFRRFLTNIFFIYTCLTPRTAKTLRHPPTTDYITWTQWTRLMLISVMCVTMTRRKHKVTCVDQQTQTDRSVASFKLPRQTRSRQKHSFLPQVPEAAVVTPQRRQVQSGAKRHNTCSPSMRMRTASSDVTVDDYCYRVRLLVGEEAVGDMVHDYLFENLSMLTLAKGEKKKRRKKKGKKKVHVIWCYLFESTVFKFAYYSQNVNMVLVNFEETLLEKHNWVLLYCKKKENKTKMYIYRPYQC